MKPEDKQLLLKDLCGRLPYGVIVYHPDYDGSETIDTLFTPDAWDDGGIWCTIDDSWDSPHKIKYCKPYLRPMSSMTEEEKKELVNHVLGGKGAEFFHVTEDGSIDGNQNAEQDLYELNLHWLNFCPLTTSSYIDWLNAHHFDYRGLIDRGLAIEVTKDNNPYKD